MRHLKYFKESYNEETYKEIMDVIQEVIDEYSLEKDYEDYVPGLYYELEYRKSHYAYDTIDKGMGVYFLWIKCKGNEGVYNIHLNPKVNDFLGAVESIKKNIIPRLENIGCKVKIVNDPTNSQDKWHMWLQIIA